MASTRKSRMMNKRISKVNEDFPDKDGGTPNKSKIRKRKLSDMLGSQWSKEEIERFHEAYRKFGKDWKKVAGTLRNRSLDMVEALYNMNKAYLSLPEGETTAAGLIAMMTDHYNILEGSDSDRERNDGLRASSKSQKLWRGKFRDNVSKGAYGPYPDLLRYQSDPSSYGCLSLLKKKRTGGSRPRAVGKRTPRFPVSYTYGYDKDDEEKFVSPNKQGRTSEGDADDDEGAHAAALALAEASQRGGSPQVSRTPGRRTNLVGSSPMQSRERKHAESEFANFKFLGAPMDEDCLEGSLGSREAENGDFVRNASYLLDSESTGAFETQKKVRKSHARKSKTLRVENNQLDDVKEACSGTEEGLNARHLKDEFETEVTNRKTSQSSQGPRKRSRQLFREDETTALDALQTLADLSLNIMLPDSNVESESSVQVKEEKRNAEVVEKPNVPETIFSSNQRERISSSKDRGSPSTVRVDVVTRKKSRLQKGVLVDANASSETKKQPHQSLYKGKKRKRKPIAGKVIKVDAHVDSSRSLSQKTEVSIEDGKRSISKAKHGSQIVPFPKQVTLIKPPQNVSSVSDQGRTVADVSESTAQVLRTNQVNLRTKNRSWRKMERQKVLAQEVRSSEVARDGQSAGCLHLVNDNDTAVDLKDKLSHCLSADVLRRWCRFEWFYSAIDYPWFAKSEFVEYLNHVGLGHVPRLTRVEWSVIRSSLGKPRRLSPKFLKEEREKLEQYRESVRTHYAELRAGVREGLPSDLARPLSVGQRVIACHPKTREIHDGSILTVDRNRCRVQFDRPELGVEFVLDIDCMPLNTLENMPDALRRRNLLLDKFCEGFNGTKIYAQPKEWSIGGSMKFAPTENMETPDGTCHVALSNYPMNALMKQAKGDTIDAILQAKAAANEVAVAAQQAMYSPPGSLAQIQAREADIKALSELFRALDKKEALLMELRHMNEEVSIKQKEGDTIREFDHFKKQYAMVLLQLRDANDQVGSALLYLRQRNTYQGNSTTPWLRPLDNLRGPSGPPGTFNSSDFLNQDTGSHVVHIVGRSRRKAKTMVDVAVQAMFSLKEGDDVILRVGEALDSQNLHSTGDSGISVVKAIPPSETGHGNSMDQHQVTSLILEPTTAADSLCPNSSIPSDGNEAQLPSELISSCVATLIMIQTCSERQYPPAEVAQILDSAISGLQSCCSQNFHIYREIEQCMGIIKNQMLALVPTPSTSLPTELAVFCANSKH